MSGAAGFYGKLPGMGDFVRRRLPAGFVDGWDRHFQHAVETGRCEMGERWTTAWQPGLAWRFVLPPQVCGDAAWCGLIGPAVDRIGRAFPMVLAAPCVGDVEQIFASDVWFDALERVYRLAQHEPVSVEVFDAQVAALPDPLAYASDVSALWRELPWDSGQWHMEMRGGGAAGVMLTEAWRQLGRRPGPWCLWWTEGAARVLATRGLPRSYAAMLEPAQWQRHAAAECAERSACEFEGAFAERSVVRVAHTIAESSEAMLWLDDGRTLVLSADDGPPDARRVAARGIRETVVASAPDQASLRGGLMSLHARLREACHDVSHAASHGEQGAQAAQFAQAAANENGAAIVVRFDGTLARLLRVGVAALWHWRRGQLLAAFVERAAGAGGEFDDLLFGDAWLDMPGIGASFKPDCDEAAIEIEPGDRLLLLVTRELVQLPQDCLADALSLPTCDDARTHLAIRAGLGTPSEQWPLAVVEVQA